MQTNKRSFDVGSAAGVIALTAILSEALFFEAVFLLILFFVTFSTANAFSDFFADDVASAVFSLAELWQASNTFTTTLVVVIGVSTLKMLSKRHS